MKFLIIFLFLPIFGLAQNVESRQAFLAINGKRSELKLRKLSYSSDKQTECDAQAVLYSIGQENKLSCDGCLDEIKYEAGSMSDLLKKIIDPKAKHMAEDQTGVTVSVMVIDSKYFAVIRTQKPF
jgi:hypothetical protein